MEKQNFSELIKKAKSNKQSNITQKVVPLKDENINEVQFSFYIEKLLLKKLKLRALDDECSMKNIITNALKNYLKTN
jgi:hypothetical protein